MDTHAITVGPAPDHEAFLRTDQTVWFSEVGREPPAEQLLGVPAGFRFAAQVDGADPDTYPGIYGVRPMTLSVPGVGDEVRRLPVRRPHLGRRAPRPPAPRGADGDAPPPLREVRDEPGWHLSALHASEPAIYGRHGYGLASLEHSVRPGPRHDAHRAAPRRRGRGRAHRVRARRATRACAARVRRCWERGAAEDVGMITGDDDFYEAICASSEEDLRGKEPMRVLFARVDGEDVGLAGFRREHKWEHGRPGGDLTVFALVGGPAARLALLRRLVDFDLIGTVKVWSRRRRRPAAALARQPARSLRGRGLRQPVGAPRRPARGAGGARVRRRLRPGARRRRTRPRPGTPAAGACTSTTAGDARRRADRRRRRPAAPGAGPRGALPRRRLPGGLVPRRAARAGPARRGPRALARACAPTPDRPRPPASEPGYRGGVPR